MSKLAPPVEMTITELQRSGAGSYEDTKTVFRWTGAEHSSAQGDIELYLKVATSRKEIPGGNTVVEHVLAATWQPFELRGEWDDKWGNRRFPSNGGLERSGAYAFTMYQEFAALVARAPMVRIEVDALSLIGIITDLRLRYQRQTKIGWAVTFSPHQNEVDQVFAGLGGNKDSQAIPKWIQDTDDERVSMNAAFDSVKDIPLRTPRLDAFSASLLEINDAIDRLQGIVEGGFDSETMSQIQLLTSTFRRVGIASRNVADDISELITATDLAFTDALYEMRYAEWIHTTIHSAWDLVGTSRSAEKDLKRRSGQKPRAIYYPKKGESLERISARFYGTADNWRAIYDANHLSSLILEGTEELLIPERGA